MRIASAPISSARRAAAVSVVKNGFPVPAAKMTIAALLQMADRAAADVGLGHLAHRDRREDARVRADALERVLHREAVEDRGEHARVVRRRPVHALRGSPAMPR